ncbi:hypothetical protein [Thiohalocapsa sp.]|uniref:beta strand repeat-containing protein n=1 Tax=Thiohalocapsa sp. TaxID=2497641 RepID=UPI0025EC5CFD|nr:hypothetical protein [Thiohalocapsa sp.]
MGLAETAGADAIELIDETVGTQTNVTAIDYILMDAATVDGDVTNDTGGTIAGNAAYSAIGVYDGSAVTGAIKNNVGGSIGSTDLYNYTIEIRDSSVAGGIRNDGSLSSVDTAVVIDAGSGEFAGGIVNGGSISSGGLGVDFYGQSFSGEISNSGSIESAGAGVYVYVDGDTGYGGDFDGGIDNTGIIQSISNAGMQIYAGSLSGGVSNSGTVSAASDTGVYLEVGTLNNGLVNDGTIASGDDGIYVQGDSLDGGFSNTGSITSSDGNGVVLSIGAFSGGIDNSGTITAAGDGLSLNVTDFGDGVVNTGAIQVQGSGILVDSGALVAGDIRNGTGGAIRGVEVDIDGAMGYIRAARGISLAAGAELDGGVINEGRIDAEVSIDVAEDAVSGAIENAGTLKGDLSIAGSNTAGDGIDLANTGSIDLGVPALYPSLISGDFMQTGSGSLAFTLLSFTDYAGLPPLTILGSVDLAGDLLLGFDEGFSYAPFARLTLIGVGGARTGLFDNYAGNALVKRFDSRRAVYIDYTEDGDIALYTTPLPPTWLLFGLGLLGWYEVARRPG